MDRKTARKYLHTTHSPEELRKPHTWRTRPDPLEKIWAEAEQMLELSADLEAKTLFEYFLAKPESGLEPEHLRTFQRRVRHWRATCGPEKEVYFPQNRKPGELLQLDWTRASELQVTIQGKPLDHLFCHCVLPYSNWHWATRCSSESFLSLLAGLQAALSRLGKVPLLLGTDNSSAATHELNQSQHREFNVDYLEVCAHYGLKPVTINVGCPHEQGDVESQNGHLKRRLEQHLLLRGRREFSSLEEYDRFVESVLLSANAGRTKRLEEELAVMRALPPSMLAEYREMEAVVNSNCIIRVKKIAYSVPSQLMGHTVRVRLYESELKVYLGREFIAALPRVRGDRGALIDFRHLVGPLLRKPGAFVNYQHREQLYPSATYRAACDRLMEDHGQRPGIIEYLQVLKLAAELSVERVEEVLQGRLKEPGKWRAAQLRDELAPREKKVIELPALMPELAGYDALLEMEVAHVG